ncbi:PrgI family protein [Candidatus Microgenomates bacterium]|nr:PrgI family protein [Candidatus Microgenomates bacterium]
MRQHAIPQNVLDVEFKLFTKFTLKEFAYLALGIGFGGLMIYLTVDKVIPAVLGIPVFFLSSISGIFLGLVPINDQDADKFIQSYISAINNPTQRAWLNKKMKAERIKPAMKPNEEGKLVAKEDKNDKPKIIGATFVNTVKGEEIEETKKEETTEDVEVNTATPAIDQNNIIITEDNIDKFQFNISSADNLPGNINVWISTKDLKPIPNIIVYLKTKDDKMLYANKTGPNGYFLTNKIWDPGIYVLYFEHPQYKFPRVEIHLAKKENKLPIKINAI